jgi:hypothetical protein
LARGSRVASAALLVLLTYPAEVSAGSAWAQVAQLTFDQRGTLNELNKLLNEDIANTRVACAMGQQPKWVADKRAHDHSTSFPDASDTCVSVLAATARDGHLSELYAKLLAQTGGDPRQAEGLPEAIGGAALANQKSAPIGNGKGLVITPALAFDAGFTAAEKDRGAKAPGTANAAQLKGLAEGCLAQQQSAGPCFSAGYMYGAQAVRGQISFAR